MSVVATLDHVVVNARDDLDAAAALYRRLGFTLTPRGRHTLGTENHLAMFGTDYLELIAAPPGRDDLPPMAWPPGLNALVFGTEDAAVTYAALAEAGVPASQPLSFSRPVALAGGPRDAAFRTVNLADGTLPGARAYFCQHLTRDVVWRDEWRRHPNGVVGVAGVFIRTRDTGPFRRLLPALFGPESIGGGYGGGVRLACGLTRVEVIGFDAAEALFGTAAPVHDGRGTAMIALVLRTSDLLLAKAALDGIPGMRIRVGPITGVVVPASEALGVTLVFVE